MQNPKKVVDERTDGVTLSLLELLIAAKNHDFKKGDEGRLDGVTKIVTTCRGAIHR